MNKSGRERRANKKYIFASSKGAQTSIRLKSNQERERESSFLPPIPYLPPANHTKRLCMCVCGKEDGIIIPACLLSLFFPLLPLIRHTQTAKEGGGGLLLVLRVCAYVCSGTQLRLLAGGGIILIWQEAKIYPEIFSTVQYTKGVYQL